jgi:hypothetical protein
MLGRRRTWWRSRRDRDEGLMDNGPGCWYSRGQRRRSHTVVEVDGMMHRPPHDLRHKGTVEISRGAAVGRQTLDPCTSA